jgi:nicotinate-nucleotide adenylyltransferase
MGSDSLQNLPKWKNSEWIMKNYKIYVYPRPGFEIEKTGANVIALNAPLLQLSSTQIRSYAKQGKSLRYMVPDSVLEEIERGGYYKK